MREDELVTPYEQWKGHKPSVKHMKLIGSKVYVHVRKKEERTKLSPVAKIGTLVGYGPSVKFSI